jgi:hypothetical protein
MDGASKPKRSEHLSWDSPKLTRIGDQWHKQKPPAGTEEKFVLTTRTCQLVDTLKRELSKSELAQVAASCSTMPADEENRSEFAATLPAAIAILCVESGDRDTLVTLFAARYPKQVNLHVDTEAYVVQSGGVDELLSLAEVRFGKPKGPHFRQDLETAMINGFDSRKVVGKEDVDLLERTVKWCNDPKNREKYWLGGRFTDPILILTDAYDKATDGAVRRDIAMAIRHAFTGLGVTGKNDSEFVKNAVGWYVEHRDRLEFNLDYTQNSIAAGFFDYETNPLFVLRPAEKKGLERERDRKVPPP